MSSWVNFLDVDCNQKQDVQIYMISRIRKWQKIKNKKIRDISAKINKSWKLKLQLKYCIVNGTHGINRKRNHTQYNTLCIDSLIWGA